MSRDYRGDMKWCSWLIVNKTRPLMYEVQVATGIISRRHIDQLKTTAVDHTVEVTDTDTVQVSQPEVASIPPAPIQLSAPPNVVGTVPEIPVADQPEMVPVPTPIAPDPPEATPSVPRSASDGTLRECAGHHRDSTSEWFFCFSQRLQVTGHCESIWFVSLRLYFRHSYKLGTEHFCVDKMLWSPCAFSMYSNYMRTHRFNKNVFVVNRHAVRVRSQISRQ